MAMASIISQRVLSSIVALAAATGVGDSFGAVTSRLALYDDVLTCNTAIMSTSRSRNSRVFTVSFPEPLAQQVEQIAKEESRNVSELMREAFRAYQFQKFRRRLLALRPEEDPADAEVTPEDIEAFVDEIRSEEYNRRLATR